MKLKLTAGLDFYPGPFFIKAPLKNKKRTIFNT